jgi:hypothetical protein
LSQLLGVQQDSTLVPLFIYIYIVLYITFILSKFEYASVIWNTFIFSDSKMLENVKSLQIYAVIDLFTIILFVIKNRYSITYILKRFIPGYKILTKLTVTLLWLLLVSVYPLSKLETTPPLTSVMSQDLALQQGASRLQTTSENLWRASIDIPSPLRIHFPLRNPTELHQHRVTCINFLPRIKF